MGCKGSVRLGFRSHSVRLGFMVTLCQVGFHGHRLRLDLQASYNMSKHVSAQAATTTLATCVNQCCCPELLVR
jgi:hypothetical protein